MGLRARELRLGRVAESDRVDVDSEGLLGDEESGEPALEVGDAPGELGLLERKLPESGLNGLDLLRVVGDLSVHALDEGLDVVGRVGERLAERAGLRGRVLAVLVVLSVLVVLVILGPEASEPSEGRRPGPGGVLIRSEAAEACGGLARIVRVIGVVRAKPAERRVSGRVICIICVIRVVAGPEAPEAGTRRLSAELEAACLVLGAEASARASVVPEGKAGHM